MEKLIRIYGNDLNEINSLLADGWTVKMMAPVLSSGSTSAISVCYIVLQKNVDETPVNTVL